jgi:hypothetical protein
VTRVHVAQLGFLPSLLKVNKAITSPKSRPRSIVSIVSAKWKLANPKSPTRQGTWRRCHVRVIGQKARPGDLDVSST